jgi:hypothetical protein
MTLKRLWPQAAQHRGTAAESLPLAPEMIVRNEGSAPAQATPKVSECGSVTSSDCGLADIPSRSARTRQWRQRALIRKGAGLYSTASAVTTFGSLAMLDENGTIVAWYEGAGSRQFGGGTLINNHVSQLYLPEDVALGVPVRDLCSATIHGTSSQTGWRRGSEGTTFWATTVIKPILLRDGRLQGFSYLTQRSSVRGERHFGLKSWPQWFKDAGASSKAAFSRVGIRRATRSGVTGAALLGIFVASQIAAAASPERTVMPSHALANPYGTGWECEHGYRRVNDTCAVVAVPANAYLDANGNRWRCSRGFLNVNEACVGIKVPANAFLDDSYGTGWACARGYRHMKGACVAVQIPANAYAVDSSVGSGWECERGYALRSGACEAVPVPANGYLTGYGDGWNCNRGFAKSAKACVQIEAPPNGFLDVKGNDWACERGFQKTDSACAQIKVPANAHLDYSGNAWRCDRGFLDQDNMCVTE